MTWEEFADLVGGLSSGTALAAVVQVRTETDPEAIRRMSAGQRRMRADWQRRRALSRDPGEYARFLAMMQEAFASMYGEPDGDPDIKHTGEVI